MRALLRSQGTDVCARLAEVFKSAARERGKCFCKYSEAEIIRKAPLNKEEIEVSHGLLEASYAICPNLLFKKTDIRRALVIVANEFKAEWKFSDAQVEDYRVRAM